MESAPPASELLVQTTSSQSAPSVASAGVQSVPAGAIFDFGGNSAPTGYLLCDGSAVSRTTYSALFTAIGVLWGAGDGSTTFNLPDIQGRVTVGLAGASGHADVKTVAGNDGVAIGSRRPKHRSSVSDPGHTHLLSHSIAGSSGAVGTNTNSSPDQGGVISTATTGITVGPQTGSEPVDVVPYVVTPKIIKT